MSHFGLDQSDEAVTIFSDFSNEFVTDHEWLKVPSLRPFFKNVYFCKYFIAGIRRSVGGKGRCEEQNEQISTSRDDF